MSYQLSYPYESKYVRMFVSTYYSKYTTYFMCMFHVDLLSAKRKDKEIDSIGFSIDHNTSLLVQNAQVSFIILSYLFVLPIDKIFKLQYYYGSICALYQR